MIESLSPDKAGIGKVLISEIHISGNLTYRDLALDYRVVFDSLESASTRINSCG
jgi:hypothetical protein